MSGRFYDFDKDDSFDEVYSDKIPPAPRKNPRKEYEITLSVPGSSIKSTMPQKTERVKAPAKKSAEDVSGTVKKTKRKMSTGKKVLIGTGIVLSCLIVYLLSLAATLFGWIPTSSVNEPEEESSAIDDVEKIDEYVEISDDGAYVEVVPMYKDIPESSPSNNGSNSGGSSTNSGSNGESNSEGGDSSEGGTSEDTQTAPPSSGGDEVFDV